MITAAATTAPHVGRDPDLVDARDAHGAIAPVDALEAKGWDSRRHRGAQGTPAVRSGGGAPTGRSGGPACAG